MAYSNSSLVSYTRLVRSHSGLRKHDIDTITPHCAAGQFSLKQFGDRFANLSKEFSANYGIDSSGKVGMYVEEKYASWSCNSSSNDNRSVNIEVSSDSFSPYAMTDDSYQSLIKLCADICRRNGKKKLLWLKNKSITDSYDLKSGEMVLTVHRWFANKSCPGDWLYNRLDELAASVNSLLNAYTGVQLSSATSTAPITSMSGSSSISVDYSKLKPYVAQLSGDSNNPNWDILKAKGFSGSLIHAGYLFNSYHTRQETFRDVRAYDHVKSTISANLPFGYYMPARARTSNEARDEMYELSFLVRKYPPRLGVWLELDLGGDKTFKDGMIKIYQDELIRLGLKGKIGFKLKRSDLSLFSWQNFQNDWALWLVDKVTRISDIDALLTPEFFDTDGKSG